MKAGYSSVIGRNGAFYVVVAREESGAGLAHAGYSFWGIDAQGAILMYKPRGKKYADKMPQMQ